MRWLPVFLFLVLSAGYVSAIGVSPPIANLAYEPGKTYQFSVRVLNLNEFPIALETRTTGPLSAPGVVSVQLPATIPARGAAEVPITIVLPETRERPGHEKSYIYFKESFIDKVQGFFAVRTEVGILVDVWQPYPGSYAEIAASAASVSEGADTLLQVRVNNLGVEPIVGGSASVRVVSANGVLQDTFSFAPIDMEGNSNTAFQDVIPSSGYEPGKYVLESQLIYGNNVSRMNGSFIVGKQDVDALGVQGTFYLDQPVNKFEIPVESLWNLPLNDVYAVFTLGAHSTQTPTIALDPFGRSTLSGYWETDRAIAPGAQDASVALHFPGGTKDYSFPITLHNETPQPPQPQQPTIVLSAADIIFAVLAAIIVVCIVVFALHRHRKQPPELPPITP